MSGMTGKRGERETCLPWRAVSTRPRSRRRPQRPQTNLHASTQTQPGMARVPLHPQMTWVGGVKSLMRRERRPHPQHLRRWMRVQAKWGSRLPAPGEASHVQTAREPTRHCAKPKPENPSQKRHGVQKMEHRHLRCLYRQGLGCRLRMRKLRHTLPLRKSFKRTSHTHRCVVLDNIVD